jgi:hypothetical protein
MSSSSDTLVTRGLVGWATPRPSNSAKTNHGYDGFKDSRCKNRLGTILGAREGLSPEEAKTKARQRSKQSLAPRTDAPTRALLGDLPLDRLPSWKILQRKGLQVRIFGKKSIYAGAVDS